MASLRLSERLLELAGLADKNRRLKAYEAERQRINAKSPIQGRQPIGVGGLDTSPESDVRKVRDDEVPAWKANDDEYRANLALALKMMGSTGVIRQDDISAASELVKSAYEKFGSVDPMKMMQILKYSGEDDETATMLPEKRR